MFYLAISVPDGNVGYISRFAGTVLALALALSFVVGGLPVGLVSAAPALSLNWTSQLGVATYLSAQAADLRPDIPGLEIVITGVSRVGIGLTNGTVACLNGRTGAVIWSVEAGNIQDHSPFEIVDLNRDGSLEIVVSNDKRTIALNGEDGSVYWNVSAPSYDCWPAVGDVNGDGYPEVFVSSGFGPYEGVDYITELSHDGNVLAQNVSWHPCWGGLSIGDANFDGQFEVYQGDRGIGYNPSDDPYKYGGWGVRCLDALTLRTLWNRSDIACSSHIPMLADVDKDGILDVIVGTQDGSAIGSQGIAVLNALDGSVVTTGGKYRLQVVGISTHSQPTICDIDYDGNLEFIGGQDQNVAVWDLFDWKLEGLLPVVEGDPPKVGDVNGDGRLDIVTVSGSEVRSYSAYVNASDPARRDYFVQVDYVSGLSNPNPFTLLADVDADGFNELVVTSRSGYVCCYDTLSTVSTPRPRSETPFYSGYRLGVAEYVPSYTLPPNHYTLTVNTIGSGSVTKNPNQASYASGSLVALTAVPAAGWTFGGWSGALSGTANPTAITMNGNKTITATFEQGTFTITASVQGVGGTIAPSGTVQVLGGQDITFIVTPSTDYHVESVRTDGTNRGSLSSYTFNDVAANHTITATFAANQYILTIIVSGGGRVTKNPSKTSYSYGETVTLTAVPNKNRVFSGWSGDLTGATNPATILVNSNKTVYATFTRAPALVIEAPVADYTYSPLTPIVNETVNFDASISKNGWNGTQSIPIITYAWDFGDGNTAIGQVVTHAYADTGDHAALASYTVTLNVTDSEGLWNSAQKLIQVGQPYGPVAEFTTGPEIGRVGKAMEFDASSSIEGWNGTNAVPITGYLWDFGDGNVTSTNDNMVAHVYASPGTFNATLTILDAEGAHSECSANVSVVMPTFVSVGTSSASVLGSAVGINGTLQDTYGNVLESESVVLSYTFPGANSWYPISSDVTDSFGDYHVQWSPPATGYFIIKAEWAGNATYSGTNDITTLSTLPYHNEYVFSVESNSTISGLSFNTTDWTLSFVASRSGGTTGYTKVTVAKILAANPANIRIYLDGNQTQYSIAQTDDSWILTFNYADSIHEVVVDLNTETIPEFPPMMILPLLILFPMTVGLILKRRKARSQHTSSIDKGH